MRILVVAALAVGLVVPAPVLAGDVLAVAKGGKLVIKGSDDGDEVIVTAAGQDLQVAPGGATSLNGGFVPQTFTVTGKITIDLGAGDDLLTFDGVSTAADLGVKLGDGFDTFRFENANIGGKGAIDLGAGAASVSFCNAAVAKGLSIKAGDAAAGIAEAGCTGIDNADAEALDGPSIVFGNFSIGGNLGVKLKTGNATVIAANSGTVGKAAFAFGDGTTYLGLCDAGVGQSLSVKMKNGGTPGGTLVCTIGSSSVILNGAHSVLIGGVDVGGSVSVKGGKEQDVVSLTDATIGEKMKLALSDGDNIVAAVTTLVGSSFSMTTGKGADVFETPTITIGESAKLSVGAGGNSVALGTSAIGGNLTIKAGDGDDEITTDQVVVGGKKTIKPGGGNNTVP